MNHGVPFVESHLFDRPITNHPSIIHQDVQPAMVGLDLLHQSMNLVSLSDIGMVKMDNSSLTAKPLGQLLRVAPILT